MTGRGARGDVSGFEFKLRKLGASHFINGKIFNFIKSSRAKVLFLVEI